MATTLPNLDAARLFVNIGQDLMAQPDLAATHERIVSMAVKLTGCTSAAILTVLPSGEMRITASSDPMLTGPLAQIMTQTGQGPALGCGQGFSTANLPRERRWPEYAQQVLAETSIRSEAAYRLQADGGDFGVLALHSVEAGYFTDDVCAVAEIYAA